MGKVDAGNVHASANHRFEHGRRLRRRADSTDNFGFLCWEHNLSLFLVDPDIVVPMHRMAASLAALNAASHRLWATIAEQMPLR
jgi:hypothetical protein